MNNENFVSTLSGLSATTAHHGWRRGCIFAALCLASSSASALNMTFFGEDLGLGESTPLTSWPNATAARTSFLSNLVGVGTEDFEAPDQVAGQTAPLTLTFPGAGTATLGGTGSIISVAPGTTNGVGRYPTSGTQLWQAGSASTEFNISFSTPIAAFGFNGIDIGDFGGQVTVTTTGGMTTTYNVGNTINGPGGSVLFWGLINTADPFTSLSFGNTNPGVDFFGFDDMTIGTMEQVNPMPEPASLGLIGLGLAALMVTRRRTA